MKTIGLVGGLSWISTQDYYRHINQITNNRLGGDEAAELILYSVNFADIKKLTLAGDWDGITRIITKAALTLQNAGADCIMLGANTMHKIADEVQAALGIPLIHIAEATARAIQQKELNKVALLGTQYTMRLDFYKNKLQAAGIETMIPDDDGIDVVNTAIYEEMGKGIFLPKTKQRFIDIIEQLAANGAQGVILGCTEIPMLLKQEDVSIPIFDTAFIHSEAAVDFAVA
jgi:aspartate racemase